MPELNYRQILFVAEYMVDGHAGPAAIRAGYSPRSSDSQGVALLKNPKVAKAIEEKTAEKLAKVAERADLAGAKREAAGLVTVPWVLGLFHDVASRCSEPGAFMPAQVLRAGELAGKHLNMFAAEPERQTNVTFNLSFGEAPGYFEREAAAGLVAGEVIDQGGEHDQGTGEGGPERQLRAGPSGSGQGAEVGGGSEEGEGSQGDSTG